MSTSTENSSLSPTKQALLRIRDLKRRLAEAEGKQTEAIAIVSMSCRFPRNSQTPDAFWQSLVNGTDEVSEVPPERWDLDPYYDDDIDAPGKMYARRGAFLDKIDGMDADFFGISPREATWLDPQQRLLLESSWEALEHAGWTADLTSRDVGVFVAWMHNDYQNEASDSLLALNPYIATGSAGSFLCGRLSYYLGIQGPSLAVDTACSSSLVALHLACQSLRQGECERAIVGGVNVMISPKTTVMTCKLHALSPQGHSRAFDASADGYLRGEGCGVVTLKRLADAERDGDPILAVIRGSAITHNGLSSGLTAPNPDSQQKAIRQALEMACVAPHEIDYLEAHGTGTELGDPLEMQAAAAVLGEDRDATHPLLVGSVKTNIGHLEAAAGMAGLLKVILAIQHETIPPHLHFETPNPHIPWDQLPVKIVTESTAWPSTRRRLAGVSAFGMSGTNAHVVVEAPAPPSTPAGNGKPDPTALSQDPPSVPADSPASQPVDLLVLSGKSDEAVQQLASRYARRLRDTPDLRLSDVCFSAGTTRRHLERRAALLPTTNAQACELLDQLASGNEASQIFRGQARRAPVVAWQFTGQGSQYLGVGKQLYRAQRVFRETLDQCDARLREYRDGASLLTVMFESDAQLQQTTWTQPALFATHLGLARLMQSWGIQPDFVMGHSLGQYAAACVSGMLDWEEGLWLIHERSRLTGSLPPGGAMAAVFANAERVEEVIADNPEVSIAAYNGSHIVISGSVKCVEEAVETLAADGVRCKRLQTSHAFHSHLLDPILDEFTQVAESLHFQPGQRPLVCNVTGEVLPVDRLLDGTYWRRHLREPVQYVRSIQTLAEAKCDIVLELGPHPVLTGMARACWPGAPSALIGTLTREVDDSQAVAGALGQLYVQGVSLDFAALPGDHAVRKVSLPTYPFQRKHFWGPAKPGAANVSRNTVHPLLGAKLTLAGVEQEDRFETRIAPEQPQWLADHAVFGDIVFPGAAYVEMANAAAGGQAVLENLAFEMPLQIDAPTFLQTVVKKGGEQQAVEIHSTPTATEQWVRNCSAMVGLPTNQSPTRIQRGELETRCQETVDVSDFYETFFSMGIQYGPQFRTIETLRHNDQEVLAQLHMRGDARGFGIQPFLLDGAFQTLAVGLMRDPNSSLFLPVGIERFECFSALPNEIWSHAEWQESEGDLRTANITLFDDQGAVLAKIEKLKLRAVSRSALRQMVGSGPERLMYRLAWHEETLPEATNRPGRWLVVGEAAHDTTAVSAKLAAQGQLCVDVALLPSLDADVPDARHAIAVDQDQPWHELLSQILSEPDGGVSGVVWCVDATPEDEDLTVRLAQAQLHCRGLLGLLHALRELKIEWFERGLQIVTQQGVAVHAEDAISAHASQFWGFGRVIGTEHPALRCRLIDVEDVEQQLDSLVNIFLTDSRESQMALRGTKVSVPRLVPYRAPTEEQPPTVDAQGTYLITGGLGMLGRRAAEWLTENGAGHLVLVSRRPPSESVQASIEAMESRGTQVHVKHADIGDANSIRQLMTEIKDELPPLKGIIHAAGVLRDGLLAEQSWESFAQVLAPKEIGAWTLHELTREDDLDFFILYSSAASVLGSPGQANYAMGNAFLDGLAHQRIAAGLPALSVNWGPWNEGMAATETVTKGLARQGMTPITSDEAHLVLTQLLHSHAVQATVLDVDWSRMRERLRVQAPPLLDAVWPEEAVGNVGAVLLKKLREVQPGAREEVVVAHVQSELQQILSLPKPPAPETQLADLGLDSLMAVELSTRLQQQVGSDYAIPPTIAFDYPSIESLAAHLAELVKDTVSEEAPTVERTETVEDAVAVIGVGCRFPGAESADAYWQLLRDGIDATSDIPANRWDLDRYFDPERKPGKMYTRRGGFLEQIDQFDADFFGISAEEACWMDPQHRLLLETTWEAFEYAGLAPQQLPDPSVGVFMGLMSTDYAQLHEQTGRGVESFQGAGFSHSAGVGRISYLYGFEGPSVAIDSASSSSLVAVCQAVRSLLNGDCQLAVAGGVNAILSPTNTLLLSKAGMLSPDGRCKSFSAQADGFGRGEGCGVVLLKRLSDAERDGDQPLAVIRGTAVAHNGHNGGLTAPSGRSQEKMLRQALANAGLTPADVRYLEAHGTGTELGDPIELRAAASVLGKGRKPDNKLLVGSAKANIGHLEAAGGISGLIKVVLSLQHGVIPGQIHFDEPSPHIPWKQIRAEVVTETTAWPTDGRRIAGVNALGMTGTNAHVIVEGFSPEEAPPAEATPDCAQHVLTLSARTPTALRHLAERYQQWLAQSPSYPLADICYTAAVGRQHFEHRAALVVDSSEAAHAALTAIAAEQDSPAAHLGQARSTVKAAWLFGNQSPTGPITQQLYATEPTFRETIDHCEQTLQERQGLSLLAPLLGQEHPETEAAPPALGLLALQMGLAQLWQSWGVEPDAVFGCGVGQYAAACASGVMKWQDGFALAVEANALADAIEEGVATFTESSLDTFEAYADKIDYFPADRPLICSLSGTVVPMHQLLAGNYWRRHLVEATQLKASSQALSELACDVVLELGQPGSVPVTLQDAVASPSDWISCLPAETDELATLRPALANLYCRGCKIDFAAVDAPWTRSKVHLPTYPFQHQRFWLTEV